MLVTGPPSESGMGTKRTKRERVKERGEERGEGVGGGEGVCLVYGSMTAWFLLRMSFLPRPQVVECMASL